MRSQFRGTGIACRPDLIIARFLPMFFEGRDFTKTRGIRGFLVVKSVEKKPRFLVNTFFQKSKIFISCKINDLRILVF